MTQPTISTEKQTVAVTRIDLDVGALAGLLFKLSFAAVPVVLVWWSAAWIVRLLYMIFTAS